MSRQLLIVVFFLNIIFINAQDTILNKLDKKDSLRSIKTEKTFRSNVVTNEVHNVLFRNIYRSRIDNEEIEFNKEIERLKPYDNKVIDTVVFEQVNVFGESVYDTTIKSNKFETFLSQKLHINTKQKIVQNRYLLLKKGNTFSPYKAYENARLMRSSGIFHDVRIEPKIIPNDTNHIILVYRIQDVFPYGFSLGVNGANDFSFGVENINIAGLNHRLNTDFKIKSNDPYQVFGFGLRYTIPNVIKKSFIDAYTQIRNYSLDKSYEIGMYRSFARPEFRWAGGDILAFRQKYTDSFGKLLNNYYFENEIWLSHAFPFRSYNTTVNSIILGLSYHYTYHVDRPRFNPNEPYRYSNTNLILSSVGYSKIRYRQDRLLNGFGRTEDIPTGISLNGLYGMDYNEIDLRHYYGGQILAQYHTGLGYYINFGTRLGFFSSPQGTSQGVFDFNLQNVSSSYKLGNFRLRNYFKLRTTIGINQDKTIYLNEYNGIRGIMNYDFSGQSRLTTGFQSNLFLPVTLAGFRFYVFGLVEFAKIQPSFNNFFETPLQSGFTAGFSFKNENLIFDLIQIQYGFYPSTDNLSQRGIVLSSIIPFNFQSLDISKPRIVSYE